MIKYFEYIDATIFVFINSHNSSFWDAIMWFISSLMSLIPIYLILLFFLIKKEKKHFLLALIFSFLLIALSDQLSVRLFKDIFLRYRPCHNEILKESVHLVNGHCGGLYGFISSHAANCFGQATFLILIFKNRWANMGLIIWASLIGYSRIYLGVHYPADVVCGAILGIVLGILIYKLFDKTKALWVKRHSAIKLQ